MEEELEESMTVDRQYGPTFHSPEEQVLCIERWLVCAWLRNNDGQVVRGSLSMYKTEKGANHDACYLQKEEWVDYVYIVHLKEPYDQSKSQHQDMEKP